MGQETGGKGQMNQDREEREIDLKDLFFSLLYRWRGILAITVVCAIVIAGVLGIRALQGTEASGDESYESQYLEYETKKADDEALIAKLQKGIDEQTEYLENSILMQINPYDKPEVSAEVLISADISDMNVSTLNAVLNYYEYRLTKGGYLRDYADEQGEKLRYAKEQITISSENFAAQEYTSTGITVQEQSDSTMQGVLHITVTALTMDDAIVLYNVIEEQLSVVAEKAVSAYGQHTCEILSTGNVEVVDSSLFDKQQSVRNYLNTLNTTLETTKTSLEALEEPSDSSGGLTARKLLKYILFGILGGFVIAVCWYGIRYILKDAVISEEQIKRYYGIRGLGTLRRQPKARAFSGIDRFFQRLDQGKHVMSEADTYEVIATNLKSSAGERKEILLSGMVSAACVEEVREKLTQLLPDFTFTASENVIYNVGTRKAFAENSTVVLVEQAHGTRCADLRKEIEIAGDLDAAVVGAILV